MAQARALGKTPRAKSRAGLTRGHVDATTMSSRTQIDAGKDEASAAPAVAATPNASPDKGRDIPRHISQLWNATNLTSRDKSDIIETLELERKAALVVNGAKTGTVNDRLERLDAHRDILLSSLTLRGEMRLNAVPRALRNVKMGQLRAEIEKIERHGRPARKLSLIAGSRHSHIPRFAI